MLQVYGIIWKLFNISRYELTRTKAPKTTEEDIPNDNICVQLCMPPNDATIQCARAHARMHMRTHIRTRLPFFLKLHYFIEG